MKLDNHLDPDDWNKLADYLAEFTAEEIRELSRSLKSNVWRPVPEDLKRSFFEQSLPLDESNLDTITSEYRSSIRPYRNGNTHSRFFGWVQGTGTVPALMADIAISAMNSNCGSRDHGAIYIERLVVDWCKQIFGFPKSAAGLLTSGTSASTHLALQVAIFKKLGLDQKKKGFFGVGKPLRCYTSREGHSSIIKAIQTSGIGSDNLIVIETDENNQILTAELETQIKKDLQLGYVPFMVIATAGTVNTGAFDDFNMIRELCDKYDCWMHIDGAFGAWLKIADDPYKKLTTGLGQADSIAFDFHKLMYVQYECGSLICRDGAFQQQVFSIRPNYLAPHGLALAGGDPWFCDFGLELSRSFRALKVWFTFKTYGLKKLGFAVSENCRLAALLAELIDQSDHFELMNKPVSTIVTFKLKNELNRDRNNKICEQIVTQLQLSGEAVFSLTLQQDYRVIRAAVINHRTREEDIKYVVDRLNQLAIEHLNT
ncbi:MAG: amino acid decarboxylase [Gammaproteobacteria bacterium]|jgi:glutamate/tyrosine decarboxylase-like PLP-dependent enzyme|nr:amino acid decarboxylase [Gammaproteobacteria bacterium]MBT3723420.1 amino acid decarboxylase [Gammaproteobacteria bacterium]MBT4077661.1 amino acid decarboxylase [Gammaproteobacteria bacterium]MBT4196334.1 amino acid decarboxylase [Gammaproteobacteria bacterium]MBT4452404.1 amino acid decarboxylase [Gammaproteobacteria bacterium]